MDYNELFCKNVARAMQERGLSKLKLANIAGISVSFVSDITTGKANPSLKIMTHLAEALQIPLPLLLFEPSGEMGAFWPTYSSWSQPKKGASAAEAFDAKIIEDGIEEIKVVLPSQKAFIVKKWAREFQELKKKKRSRK